MRGVPGRRHRPQPQAHPAGKAPNLHFITSLAALPCLVSEAHIIAFYAPAGGPRGAEVRHQTVLPCWKARYGQHCCNKRGTLPWLHHPQRACRLAAGDVQGTSRGVGHERPGGLPAAQPVRASHRAALCRVSPPAGRPLASRSARLCEVHKAQAVACGDDDCGAPVHMPHAAPWSLQSCRAEVCSATSSTPAP